MKRATLKNVINGQTVEVFATTESSASSYGRAVWCDDDWNAYCEVDNPSPFYEISNVRDV